MVPDTPPIEVTTLGDLLLRAAQRFPERDALVFPDTALTFEALWDRATDWARAFLHFGIRPHDHVGVLMPNCPEYIEALFGITLLGAVCVPINARNKAPELAYVVENADLKAIVTSDAISEYADFGALLTQALPGLAEAPDPRALVIDDAPMLRFAVMLGTPQAGFVAETVFRDAAADVPSDDVARYRQQVSLRDTCIMMYTSGTTANPKGCPLSHEALVRNGMNMNRERYHLTEEDRFWTPLPMFHMSSILPMACCYDAGAALLSMRRFDAGPALEMLERERATVAFPSFPTVMNDLITHPDFASRDLSRIRRMNNVAPPEVLEAFQATLPHAVQTAAYGLTEASGVIAFNHPDETLAQRTTTCGKPFTGIEVCIVDPETGAQLPANERGELWVRGYAVFDGYYKSPEKNAESLVDGWLRTGDLCSLDEHGGIRFHGRLKDMLKVGGENVAALEIEAHLATHPKIKFAQVVGVPDARLTEVAAAFVELHDGERMTDDEVIGHCKGQMAGFKVPRHIRFVTEWPMSSTKVQKFKLLESFLA